MPKFRSKPNLIEAHQFDGHEMVLGVRIEEDGRYYVVTIHEQKAYLEPGDWVIVEPGSDGTRCYPCKPGVFAARYEPAVT